MPPAPMMPAQFFFFNSMMTWQDGYCTDAACMGTECSKDRLCSSKSSGDIKKRTQPCSKYGRTYPKGVLKINALCAPCCAIQKMSKKRCRGQKRGLPTSDAAAADDGDGSTSE